MRTIIANLFFGILLCVQQLAFAAAPSDAPHVNILTWQGYFTPQINALIAQQCHANVSYDEYYSNDEFLRRFAGNQDLYDIVIFADSVYNLIKDRIKYDKSDLASSSQDYNETIKQHYKKSHFPPNVVYFSHTLSGFLWNPAVMSIDENDSISSIFKKAGINLVAIIDDPAEIRMLTSLELGKNISDKISSQQQTSSLTISNFNNLVQLSKVYITNDFTEIFKKPNFAFAFTWSGVATYESSLSNKPYDFLVHPKLSYVSSDFLAVLNNRSAAVCVAKVLSSKKAASILQNDVFYFSPYVDDTDVTNLQFKKFYDKFRKILPTLRWVTPISQDEFKDINTTWQLIKVKSSYEKQ